MKIILLVLVTALLSGSSVTGLTLEEILDLESRALGSVEALRNVKSSVTKADVEVGGMRGSAVTYFKAPDRFRVDLSLPLLSYSQGCVADDCWVRDGQGLTHSLGSDAKGMLVTQLALENRTYCDRASFNGEVALADTNAIVDSLPCYMLRIAPQGGAPAQLYVDKREFLPRQVTLKTDVGVYYSRFSDYRPVAGVLTPFRSTEMSDAGFVAGVTTVTSIETNVSLPDSLFMRQAVLRADPMPVRGGDSVIVPFELWRNHIYVKVRVNGKGPFAWIFDSGAGGIAISERLLPELGLVRLGATEARGVGGADSSDVFRIDTLEVDGIQLTDLMASSMDFVPLEQAAEQKIDGIFGYDLLSRFIISVDYARHQLTILRPDY